MMERKVPIIEREPYGEGFYKMDGDKLMYAPNAVYAPDYTIVKASRNRYTYPKNGWYWFDSEELATAFFETKQ